MSNARIHILNSFSGTARKKGFVGTFQEKKPLYYSVFLVIYFRKLNYSSNYCTYFEPFRLVSDWFQVAGVAVGRSACMLALIQGHNLRVGVRTAPIHNL